MTPIAFGNSAYDPMSSPFYDYANDIIYVGDGRSTLHKFTGVFLGTPAETVTGPWPVAVCNGCSGFSFPSPVYDSAHGSVYFLEGGGLYAVAASSGAVTTSAQIAFNFAPSEDAPLVDSAAGEVYAFVGVDYHLNNGDVFQFPYNFASGSFGSETVLVEFPANQSLVPLYAGTFDNAYYTSATPSSPTGHLYVCSARGSQDLNQAVYQIPITGGAMGASKSGPVLTNSTSSSIEPACSPVSEIFSNSVDWIFVSVQSNGKTGIVTTGGNTCANSTTIGCVYSFNVTSGSIAASTKAANGLATAGGSSGIIIDNTASSPAGASQIYFSTLSNQTCTTSGGTGGCAIQASQSGLQ
jgi:hypothetical protein